MTDERLVMGNLCSIRRPLLAPAPELNYPFLFTERQTKKRNIREKAIKKEKRAIEKGKKGEERRKREGKR
jgi:hypothetical protein